jgi:hypothetical protein
MSDELVKCEISRVFVYREIGCVSAETFQYGIYQSLGVVYFVSRFLLGPSLVVWKLELRRDGRL